MKKSFLVTILLLLLSVGGICASFYIVDAKQNALTIKETVLFGDKAAAEGIQVAYRMNEQKQLFWDAEYTVGERSTVHTKYRFTQVRQPDDRRVFPNVRISDPIGFKLSASVADLKTPSLKNFERSSYVSKPAEEVETRTMPGETREETFFIRDYCEFYPITMQVYIPIDDRQKIGETEVVAFDWKCSDYFKIPISPMHKIKVAVTKDEMGKTLEVTSESDSGDINFMPQVVRTTSGLFCTLTLNDAHTGENVPMPQELSGIHFIPMEDIQDNHEPKSARMVYPLNPQTTRVVRLEKSFTQEQLLLLTEENDQIMLSVLSADGKQLLHKMEVCKAARKAEVLAIKQYDKLSMICFSDGTFVLLTNDTSGVYAVAMRGSFKEFKPIAEILDTMALDYDGRRLAVVCYQCERRYGTYLLVYEKNALRYAGQYNPTIDSIPTPWNEQNTDSLSVRCK
ncbi:MAG: hypothetical protein RR053_02430 [Evtepia sp.]